MGGFDPLAKTMIEFHFEDLDAVAGERFESASDEEITLAQPNFLQRAYEDADGLYGKTASARNLIKDALRELSIEVRAFSPVLADQLFCELLHALMATRAVHATASQLYDEIGFALSPPAGEEAEFEPFVAVEEIAVEAPQVEASQQVVLSPECFSLRRQFFAAAGKARLPITAKSRAARLAALAAFVGRPLESSNHLSKTEWIRVVNAVEDGRLSW